MKMQGLGVAWFREDDFPRWRSIDPNFQPDHQHWLQRMEEVFTRYQAASLPVIRVIIEPNQFLEWSRANDAGVGTEARAAFVACKARPLDHREGMH